MTQQLLAVRKAWLLLLLISAISFLTAELMGERHIAVGVVMVIAAAKVAVILAQYMEVSHAPVAIRRYLYGWTFAVAALVILIWQMSGVAAVS